MDFTQLETDIKTYKEVRRELQSALVTARTMSTTRAEYRQTTEQSISTGKCWCCGAEMTAEDYANSKYGGVCNACSNVYDGMLVTKSKIINGKPVGRLALCNFYEYFHDLHYLPPALRVDNKEHVLELLHQACILRVDVDAALRDLQATL